MRSLIYINKIMKKEDEPEITLNTFSHLCQNDIFNQDLKLTLFGEGEWINEPDFLEWGYNGLKCIISRNTSGCLCGYAILPINHPWIDVSYFEIDCDVHGSLTFGEWVGNEYVIGFDCGHSGDLLPRLNSIKKHMQNGTLIKPFYKFIEVYRNIDFVKSEVEHLVDQGMKVME